MPAASYLHIRSGDDSPERVLPLQGTRARIGRGPQCEIQLDDPSVDEVALVLRRRGTAWHAHAAEPGGVLTIDGVEALGQRRVSGNSTLTIGNYQIRLRGEASEEIASDEKEEAGSVAVAFSETEGADSIQDRREERLEKWQASLERRERWLLARKERLKWEKRWRDAGERHRSRAVPAASAPVRARMPVAPVARQAPGPIPSGRPAGPGPAPEPEPVKPEKPAEERSEPPARGLQGPGVVENRRAGGAGVLPEFHAMPGQKGVSPLSGKYPTQIPTGGSRSPLADFPSETGHGHPPESAPRLGAVTRLAPGRVGSRGVEDSEAGTLGSAGASPSQEIGSAGASPSQEIGSAGASPSQEIGSAGASPSQKSGSAGASPSQKSGSAGASPSQKRGSVGASRSQESGSAGASRSQESGSAGASPSRSRGVEDSATATRNRGRGVEDSDTGMQGMGRGVEGSDAGSLTAGGVGRSPMAVEAELLDPEALAARWAWEMSGSAPKIKIAFAETRVPTARGPRARREPVEPSRREGSEPERSWPLALPGWVEPVEVPEKPVESLAPAVEIEIEPEEGPAEAVEIVWPSVAEIMQAHKASEEVASAGRVRTAKAQRLTDEREPASWSVPALVVVPPGLAVALMVLLGGVALNWTWSRDDRVAGQAANRLLSGALVPATGVSLEALPKDAWWSSTADHLYLYAVAQGRVEDDPERVEGSEYFLNLARGAAPVHPGVLDAQRRVSRAGGGENPAGLVSRDVVTLAREAGQRLRAGDRETGLAMYRRALEMASRSDPEQAEPAEKDSEGESQRYLLPNEDLYLAVLNDLAADGGERFADWSEAVPDYAPVLVSAYRAAHRQGRSDAEQALERAVGQPVAPSGCSEAEHLAGQAEALAILGRWEESAGRYRQAIRRSPVREHRRQYWQNLAEIHGRQGDLAKKHEALEQAWNAGREVPEDDDEGVSKRLRAE